MQLIYLAALLGVAAIVVGIALAPPIGAILLVIAIVLAIVAARSRSGTPRGTARPMVDMGPEPTGRPRGGAAGTGRTANERQARD